MSNVPELPQQVAPKTSGLAIASLVCGIISFLGGLILILPPLLAIIFGIIAIVKINKDKTLGGLGFAIAGLATTACSIVSVGLLAAMAIPAFQKVRENSLANLILNDARLIGAAAQQVFIENPDQPIVIAIDPQTGKVAAPLDAYIPGLGRGVIAVDNIIENKHDGFSLAHPQVRQGAAYIFDSEGRLLRAPSPTTKFQSDR
jgi:type IV pilus assembly protein PilA